MAEWYVSGSEPEGDEEGVNDGTGSLEIGGLRIPPSKVLELMQRVEHRKTLELECLSGAHHRQKRTKKRKRKKNKAADSPSDGTVTIVGSGAARGSRVNMEEVSETASEIRSNTSTTATECRDIRRPNLALFDPTFDPELDDDSVNARVKIVKTKKKAPPTHKQRDKKLASLDRITADAIKRKQKWHKHQQNITNQEPMIAKTTPIQRLTPPPPTTHSNQSHLDGLSIVQENVPTISFDTHMEVDNGYPREEITMPKMKELPSFRFDEDEDEDMMSEVDMKFSVLSQIDRVEKLLDSEGLT